MNQFLLKPANEFAYFIDTYIEFENKRELIEEYKAYITPETMAMYEKLDLHLSQFVKNEIVFFNQFNTLNVIVFGFLHDNPGVSLVEDIFRLFDECSDATLFNYIGGCYLGNQLKDDNGAWNEVNHDMDLMVAYIKGLVNIEQTTKNEVLNLYLAPSETKMRLKYILEKFYYIFKMDEAQILKDILVATPRYLSLLNSDPEKLYHIILMSDRIDELKDNKLPLEIHISYVAPIVTSIFSKEDRLIVTFGVKNEEYYTQKSIVDHANKFIKLIGDPTRFKILQILSKEANYTQSIAKELNMTPATINYHLQSFLLIEVLTTKIINNKVFYSYNHQAVDLYFKVIQESLNCKR